jgi:uncharacterized protein (DUF983 family)
METCPKCGRGALWQSPALPFAIRPAVTTCLSCGHQFAPPKVTATDTSLLPATPTPEEP